MKTFCVFHNPSVAGKDLYSLVAEVLYDVYRYEKDHAEQNYQIDFMPSGLYLNRSVPQIFSIVIEVDSSATPIQWSSGVFDKQSWDTTVFAAKISEYIQSQLRR